MVFVNTSNITTYLELFNFSWDEAISVVDHHLSQNHLFESSTEEAIVSCYVVLIITGVCTNVVVSGIIMKNTKVRSPRNFYVVNLNISDLILCLFCMPFTLFALLRRNWPLGALLCKLVPFVQGSTVYVSSATVSAIAVDRYKTIISCFPEVKKESMSRVLVTTVVIWMIAFALSSPLSIAQNVNTVGLPGIYTYEKCIEVWPVTYTKEIYTLVTLLAQFVIPAVVLLVTHYKIEAHLNFSINKLDCGLPNIYQERIQKELLRNRKATMVLLLISVVFGFTWMPWNIINLIADFHLQSMSLQRLHLAFAVCHMLAMTSATSNPILYGWLNANIRRELIRVGERMSSAVLSHRGTNSDNGPPTTMDKTCKVHSLIEIDSTKQTTFSKNK